MIIKKLKQRRYVEEKRREIVSYLFFGISTTAVNILVFQALLLIDMDYKAANLFAVILAKLYAYVTNKKFVFRSKCENFAAAFEEFLRFVYARGITGIIDFFGLMIAVEWLHFSPLWSKYGLQVLIIVLNYIFSKLIVFKTKEKS